MGGLIEQLKIFKKRTPLKTDDPATWTLDKAILEINDLRRQVLSLEEYRDSLVEALGIAQGEVVRVRNLAARSAEKESVYEEAVRANNEAKDEVFVMAGTLNRAREVAIAMQEPLLLMNNAVPQLPEPTTPDEEKALINLAGSMSRLIRYAGMIGNDGTQIESPVVAKALAMNNGSGASMIDDEYADIRTAVLDIALPPDWRIKDVLISPDNEHPDSIMVQGQVSNGPGLLNFCIQFNNNRSATSIAEDVQWNLGHLITGHIRECE